MKKITKNIAGWLVMAAALTVGMTSCSSEDGLDTARSSIHTLRISEKPNAI